MDRSTKFWDRIADRYAQKPIADETAYQRKLEVSRKYLRPGMQALEFGCGTGSTALIHAPRVKQMHAIDISSKMIEIAQAKAEQSGIENITFRRASIDDFNMPRASLDVVFGLSILHLLDHWKDTIAKVHWLLKPGGAFISSTSCIGDSMKFFKLIVPIGKFLGLMPTVKVFTTTDLEMALADVGFRIDHKWQPGKNKAVFIVAMKSGSMNESS